MTKSVDLLQKKQYLPNDVFLAEYNKCKLVGVPSDKLILMFEKIAKNYATMFHNIAYHRLKECIQYATECAYIKWDKFDQNKSDNAFSFFTQMIKNDMLTHLKKLKGHEKRCISIDAIFAGNEHNK